MAIIDSVKKLASKVGADTNGRTIAEQINNINRHLDSTGSRDIAEAVSKFADKEDGTAILTTKTITENNTYNASDDGASGYSSVTVNVENQMQYAVYSAYYGVYGLFRSANGEYDLRTTSVSQRLSYCVLCDPAVAIEVNNSITNGYYFTPGESFVVTLNGTPVTLSGDTVTLNDGKMYELGIGGGPDGRPQYTITYEDRDFVFEIG